MNREQVRRPRIFKLGEALREHSPDLLLLSQTPHQGDHFRFWMLSDWLTAMFENTGDMVDNRHRLNAVYSAEPGGRVQLQRRAGLCFPPTGPYQRLSSDRCRGEVLSTRSWTTCATDTTWLPPFGSKGPVARFVMTIFQKIASSSFAAVASTLRRRLLMLTIHEALVCDDNLDTDGRDRGLCRSERIDPGSMYDWGGSDFPARRIACWRTTNCTCSETGDQDHSRAGRHRVVCTGR